MKARARFESSINYPEPGDAFHALFEALAWTASIDDRLKRPNESPELRGTRFARNRVAHQWWNALVVDYPGVTFPLSFPLVFFEHRWKRADDLPPRRRPDDGEGEYRSHLQGKPARHTLAAIERYLLARPELRS